MFCFIELFYDIILSLIQIINYYVPVCLHQEFNIGSSSVTCYVTVRSYRNFIISNFISKFACVKRFKLRCVKTMNRGVPPFSTLFYLHRVGSNTNQAYRNTYAEHCSAQVVLFYLLTEKVLMIFFKNLHAVLYYFSKPLLIML